MIREVVVLIDDMALRASSSAEVKADETISFEIDGVRYEMDLAAQNAAGFRNAVAPYVAAARRTGGRKRPRSAALRSRSTKIREWARERGMEVSERGRIPSGIVAKYDKAMGQAA